MKRTEKELFVQNLTEELKSAKSLVLIDFAGLSVKNQQELKKRLKATGARMQVTKNTLFALAGKNAGLPREALKDSVLTLQTAVILSSDDPISPLSVLAKFADEFSVPRFKVGIIEGTFQDKEALTILSRLPAKNVLQIKVVGGIAAPLYGLIFSLRANLQKLLYVLSAKKTISNPVAQSDQ